MQTIRLTEKEVRVMLQSLAMRLQADLDNGMTDKTVVSLLNELVFMIGLEDPNECPDEGCPA